MSINLTLPTASTARTGAAANDPHRWHRLRLKIAYLLAIAATLVLLIYGFGYYWSSPEQRALSPKHDYLKPSGTIGLRLGMFGFLLFLFIFLYPLRKKWAWLGRQGSSRRWLDFHVLLGLLAPVVITFHSSFKFSGIAGVAYWIMVIVALSGVVGRYIYAQVPRSINSAELSLQEAQEQSQRIAAQLKGTGILSAQDIDTLLHLPDLKRVESISLLGALWKMLVFDLIFPFRVWRLRQKMLWSQRRWWSLVGLGRSQNVVLERAISMAREQTVLTKKILFLSKSHRMLHLWHVIHRPFSYSFAVLASIHVILMLMLGYY
jgi:TRAP-type C4-dicarboxylate transport system permease small subunit